MFSGIEAASVAWEPLGWECAAVCEIDPFASAVLAHHYPDVPNLGNVEEAEFDAIGPVDLAVFGSPCQSYSVAGKRLGLDDPRGNLALVAGRIVYAKRPRWFVFENVPGLLSSDSGWDFGTLLAAFAGYPPGSVFEPPANGWENSGVVREAAPDAYGLAWRVLDAQYVRVDGFGRAVPQRRRRVFVVGCLGDWRRAAAVLFERQSLSWDPPPRRQAGQAIAHSVTTRAGNGSRPAGATGNIVAFGGNNQSGPIDVATAQTAHGGTGRMDFESETFVAQGVAGTMPACGGTERKHGHGWGQQEWESGYAIPVAHALRADGFDASEDGTGRGTPLVPVPVLANGNEGANGAGIGQPGDPAFPLQASIQQAVAIPIQEVTKRTGVSNTSMKAGDGIGEQGDPMFTLGADSRHGVAICFDETQITSATNRCQPRAGDPSHPLAAGARPPTIAFNARQDPDVSGDIASPLGNQHNGLDNGVLQSWRARRLTPTECARLQGFPDDYLDIIYRGKPAADGPKYKALGNSFAVNVVRWIGQRIQMVEKIK